MSIDSQNSNRRALRGRVLTFLDNPARVGEEASFRYIEDGAVLIEDGLIKAVGEAGELLAGDNARDTEVDDHSGQLVLPGFIDLHIHYPQAGIIASYGAQLMEWLDKYTFPEEEKFSDPAYAAATAEFFFDELLRNGTTTAAVYCTTHESSVEAFFAESERRNMRMIAGKVMMDRGAPDILLDMVPENGSVAGYDASKRLAERWHGRGRQHYAVTPRFALTSSEAQLEAVHREGNSEGAARRVGVRRALERRHGPVAERPCPERRAAPGGHVGKGDLEGQLASGRRGREVRHELGA